MTPTAGVRIRFSAKDNPNGDIVEALLDDFKVQIINDDPSLWADTYSISVAQQTEVGFSLDAGAANENRSYWLLGSVTGTAPGFSLPGGHTAPLNWDLFTQFILTNLGSPLLQNFQGTLNGSGVISGSFKGSTDKAAFSEVRRPPFFRQTYQKLGFQFWMMAGIVAHLENYQTLTKG